MIFLVQLALAEPRAVSLTDAMALAATASESIDAAEADVRKADADKAAAFGGYLPSLGGSISYSHTFISEYDGLFDSGADTGAAAAANPFADLPFGKPDTWRADLSLSQVVYGGGRVRAQNQLARASQSLAGVSLHSAEASTQLDVATAYLDAALYERLLAIARMAEGQATTTLDHATEAVKVGRQPEFELLRARVELENQRVVVLQQAHYAALGTARLKQLLGIAADEAITLSTPLEAEAPAVEASGAGERLAVQQLEAAVDIAEASVKLRRSAGLPSVAVSGSGGFVSYPDNPLPPLEDWRSNLSAGASVSMPLFSGGVIRAQIRSAQAELDKARAQAAQVAELASLDEQNAQAGLDTATAQWAATAGTVEQARKAYAIAEVRFSEGVSTQAELADARILLQRAEANRAQAGRDLQLAALRVRLLHDLPLQSR